MKLPISKKYTQIILFLFFVSPVVLAQQTSLLKQSEYSYNAAVELFESKKYSSAQKCIKELLKSENVELAHFQKRDLRYYQALSSIYLFNNDAEYFVVNFIRDYSESTQKNTLKFEVAKMFFEDEKYRDATQWFEQVDLNYLTKEEQAECHFKLGYSYYQKGNIEDARSELYRIKDIASKYTSPAIYFYGHIQYELNNYQTALDEFLKLTSDENFSNIVPYYITQIYYQQGKFKEIIEYTPSILENVIESRKSEVVRILGEAYYNQKQYKEALEYLLQYEEESEKISGDDRFLIGYSYYKTKKYAQAIDYLDKLTNQETLLGQNASFALADCYLKTEERQKARLAFRAASQTNFDEKIQEEAFYNYALLTYELSYFPFNEAVSAFYEYIQKYPKSVYVDEVYEYLSQAYLSTRNYKMALESLEKIKKKDEKFEKAWQQVNFYRGLEYFSNLEPLLAIEKLEESLKYAQYNQIIAARANFWLGEAYLRIGNNVKAATYLKEFVLRSGAYQLKEFSLAHYNLGYAFFREKDYTNASSWFRKYVSLAGNGRKDLLADAYNRVGDIFFVETNYRQAVDNYNKSITINELDADYAYYQKAISLGLVNNVKEKQQTLQSLITQYPQSTYVDDALFELAKAKTAQEEYAGAIDLYNQIIGNYPNSSYLKKSLTNLGLIYYNTGKEGKALELYKSVIENYPGTQEAQGALLGIKNIYLEQNKVDEYFTYAQSVGGVDVTRDEQDSLLYRSAENVYMLGDCDKAVSKFEDYLQKFPDGSFDLNARFYIGDCSYLNKNYDKALENFEYINLRPGNTFTEQSLLGAARIYLQSEKYSDALTSYKRLEEVAEHKSNLLEARLGILRCNYALNYYKESVSAATNLLVTEKLSAEWEREAYFKRAKSYQAMNNYDEAIADYRKLSGEVKSREGAEAKYRLIQILFRKGDAKMAENEIFDFIDKNTPHQYWMARSFLLLAEIYINKDDYFQASQTLQSIIDYYEDKTDGIVKEATQLLETVRQKEEKNNAVPKLEDVEIQINE